MVVLWDWSAQFLTLHSRDLEPGKVFLLLAPVRSPCSPRGEPSWRVFRGMGVLDVFILPDLAGDAATETGPQAKLAAASGVRGVLGGWRNPTLLGDTRASDVIDSGCGRSRERSFVESSKQRRNLEPLISMRAIATAEPTTAMTTGAPTPDHAGIANAGGQ